MLGSAEPRPRVEEVRGGGDNLRGSAHRLIDCNRRDGDSSTYVSSTSTASMGLGGSMPRPEEKE